MDAGAQHIHGKRAAGKYLIVEAADVEFVSQLIFRILAKPQNLKLSDFVAERLRRPRAIAVGLALYRDFVNGGVLVEIIDHLLPRPVLVVKAGVDDQANRPQHVILQVAVVAVRILVKSDFLAQPFRVQRPSFDIGGVAFVLAEERQVGQLLRNRNLHVMSGHAFVIGGGFDIQYRALGEVAGVDHDVAGP